MENKNNIDEMMEDIDSKIKELNEALEKDEATPTTPEGRKQIDYLYILQYLEKNPEIKNKLLEDALKFMSENH